MTTIRLAGKAARFVVLLVAAVSGCTSLPQSPFRGASRAAGSAAEVAQPDVRNPKTSAKLCIVTAEGLEKQGHLREAILLYENARNSDPQAIDYARRLAVLYDQYDQPREARTEYQKALKAAPGDPDLLNDFAYFQFRHGEVAAAESLLRQALQADSEHERAWTNLGIVLAQQCRYDESFQAFAKVAGPAAAHANLGAAMLKQGDHVKAKLELQEALAMNPTLQQPQTLLAYLDQKAAP